MEYTVALWVGFGSMLLGYGSAFAYQGTELDFSKMRIEHAKELLGSSYQKKAMTANADALKDQEVVSFVKETTKMFLGKKDKSHAEAVASALMEEAAHYGLDPVFLMAVILNESSFNPKQIGTSGEIGLMQVLPETAKWICAKNHIPYTNAKSLFDPVVNIRIGAALLDQLRKQFDSEGRRYLSAYNVGAKKLKMLESSHMAPKAYVRAVMKRYLALYKGFVAQGDSKMRSLVAWSSTVKSTVKSAPQ